MDKDFDRPTEYVEDVQCGQFDGGNTFGIRFKVNGKPTKGYIIERDLAELLCDQLHAMLGG